MRAARLVLGISAILFSAASARAGIAPAMITPTPLPRQEVYSKNEFYVLVVDPDLERSNVFATSDRSRPLWSFPGVLKTDVRRILLADSGSVVALIGNGEGSDSTRVDGVRLIDRSGGTRSYESSSFIEQAPVTYGCGPASIRWFDAVDDHGDHFVIRTADGSQYAIDYVTGRRIGKWRIVIAAGVICGLLVFLATLAWKRPAAVRPAEAESPA